MCKRYFFKSELRFKWSLRTTNSYQREKIENNILRMTYYSVNDTGILGKKIRVLLSGVKQQMVPVNAKGILTYTNKFVDEIHKNMMEYYEMHL